LGITLWANVSNAIKQTCASSNIFYRLSVVTVICNYLLQEVVLSLMLVCLLAGLRKIYPTDFHKIRWKGDTWVKEEIISVDFGGNPDHVTLGLESGDYIPQDRVIPHVTHDIGFVGHTTTLPHLTVCFTRRLYNSENSAGSAASTELCALPSATLVATTLY